MRADVVRVGKRAGLLRNNPRHKRRKRCSLLQPCLSRTQLPPRGCSRRKLGWMATAQHGRLIIDIVAS